MSVPARIPGMWVVINTFPHSQHFHTEQVFLRKSSFVNFTTL
nr:MAG TPA: hypothetical protein [Caudoviricetes sp.]